MEHPLDMGNVAVKLEGIKSLLGLLLESLEGDLGPADRCAQDEPVYMLCLLGRVREMYHPALNHIFGDVHNLLELVKQSK